jgi:hypothetical protein
MPPDTAEQARADSPERENEAIREKVGWLLYRYA